MKCCICRKEFEGYGNNAEPAMKGLCCDSCNSRFVVPMRMLETSIDNNKQKLEELEKQIYGCDIRIEAGDFFSDFFDFLESLYELEMFNDEIVKPIDSKLSKGFQKFYTDMHMNAMYDWLTGFSAEKIDAFLVIGKQEQWIDDEDSLVIKLAYEITVEFNKLRSERKSNAKDDK